MSADNYILIRNEHQNWVGYVQAASSKNVTYDNQCFIDRSFMGAIAKAQKMDTEYGYKVEDIDAIIASKNWLGL